MKRWKVNSILEGLNLMTETENTVTGQCEESRNDLKSQLKEFVLRGVPKLIEVADWDEIVRDMKSLGIGRTVGINKKPHRKKI
jgi:hypothetical protein